MSIDLLSTIFGLILTLMVFSYLLDDNPLFRVAVYIFIGVSAGYAATVVCYQVLSPKLLAPLRTGDPNQLLLTVIPLFLSISLLAKLTPRISWIGNFAMAVLVGVGAAAALGGAVLGTLIPQVQAAMDAFDFRSAATTSDAFFGLLNGFYRVSQRGVGSEIEGKSDHRKLALMVQRQGSGAGLETGEGTEWHLLTGGRVDVNIF